MLVCEVWNVAPSCWKYPIESSLSSNWFTKVLKISIYMQLLWWMRWGRWEQLCVAGTSHTKHQSSLNEGVLRVSLWDFHLQSMGILKISLYRQVKPPKKFRQWHRTYWQGLSKIWRAGFNPVWTQMVATSRTCYDVDTFLTQWGKSASNIIAISSLVVKLLKKCRLR